MQTINLREVKLLNAKLAGKEPPDFSGPYLFWYTVWTFIENKTHVTLSEKQASEKLKQFPKMEVFYCKFPGSKTPMPSILKGRKGLQTVPVNSHEEVSDLIFQKTNVKVSEGDLKTKQTSWADERPLGVRANAFMKKVDAAQAKEKRVQEILKCLQKNDPRKRKDCLNNCNI